MFTAQPLAILCFNVFYANGFLSFQIYLKNKKRITVFIWLSLILSNVFV